MEQAGSSRGQQARRWRSVTVPGNVLPDLTTFIGREHEMGQIRTALAQSRLLTITGIGGIGKSRLVRQVALSPKPAFPGGVWVVELAELGDARLLDAAIARVLGIPQHSRARLRELISRRLTGRCLLILDNCEHVTAACADIAAWLLQRNAGLKIIATSRVAIGIDGETIFRVPPLDVPSAHEQDVGDLARFSAVRLFVERAQAAEQSFALTDDNATLVAAICARVDGIPLAIELAASRVGTLTLPDLLSELENQVELEAFNRDTSPRHRSMRMTLEWTYHQLPPDQQVLWRRLSIFVGGFSFHAVKSVCVHGSVTADNLERLFGSLVRSSVVVVDRRKGHERYRLLEPVRLFGRQHLAERHELAETRHRHLAWCASLLPPLAWWTGDNQLEWFGRLKDEHGNLTHALDYCLTEDVDSGLKILSEIFLFWGIEGLYDQLRHYTNEYLTRVRTPSFERGVVLFAVGLTAAWYTHDLEQAQERFAECEREVQDERLLGLASFGHSLCELAVERYDEALKLATQAAAIFDATGGRMLQASCQIQIAECLTFGPGDLEQARAGLVDNLARMHPDDLWNQGLTRSHLGLIAWRAGDPEEAETQLLSALRVQALIGHVWGQATTLERLGCLASSREEAAQAAQLFGVVDTLWEALHMSGYPGIDVEYPAWAVERKHAETHARETLGNARYKAIWRAAHRLGFDHAVTQLLCTQTDPDRSDKPLLTPREVEVARLIADGATNTEISVALMISKETVKTHVRSMLSKLGYTSRVQIGAWYAREAEDC